MAISQLQIETTSRCTLRCPGCSRTLATEKIKKPYPHYDVDADLVYNFLSCPTGRSIKELSLCGDTGDSIYYPNLFYFLEKFKPDKNIRIVTNGSYRDKKFWTELCNRLDKNDTIVFSIDGLEDTNHLYRVNSDWKSMMLGLDIVANSGINLEWATNVFSFNYNQLYKIKEFAESKGAKFFSRITGRFGKDELAPPAQFQNTQEMYFSEYSNTAIPIKIQPDCKNIYRNTICSQNYFWPCGYIHSPLILYKTNLWKNRNKWSIKNTTLSEMIETSRVSWISQIENDPSNAPIVCKMKCKENQDQRPEIKI